MTRRLDNWLKSYVKYASVTEAPPIMHFWCGVATLAGALRRHVWLDFRKYIWYPNFYVVFVAKPGIVAKTTTMNVGMALLEKVPGIKFGPNVVTWQDLVVKFSEAKEEFPLETNEGPIFMPMSAITLASGELGNLINFREQAMIDAYISLWDGGNKFSKSTKHSGSEMVEAPWINLIGCTTPSWLAQNMPDVSIGGGFTSRCVWIFASEKDRMVPWVDEESEAADDERQKEDLTVDLEYIASNVIGPMTITKEARDWYRPVYEQMWKDAALQENDRMVEGYIARKQTHLCKLAMVMSVARSDERIITQTDLHLANMMLEEIEPHMTRVFQTVGRKDESLHAERLLATIKARGKIPHSELHRLSQAWWPDSKDFENVIMSFIKGGQVKLIVTDGPPHYKWVGD